MSNEIRRTWAIGDLQGCFGAFRRLLDQIDFDPDQDRLWLCGDLVNRGPDSLATLRLCYQLRKSAVVVLGNHDLHLLAVGLAGHKLRGKDTLKDLLKADDAPVLLDWLRHCPLLHVDENRHAVLVHAGVLPGWKVREAQAYAAEVESCLQSKQHKRFLRDMYGNKPDTFSKRLRGTERLRVITNVLTRMRFINEDGQLDLQAKGVPDAPPAGYKPWFRCKRSDHWRFFFGHWAALGGETGVARFQSLDTGAVWGGTLRAVDVDSGEKVSVPAD